MIKSWQIWLTPNRQRRLNWLIFALGVIALIESWSYLPAAIMAHQPDLFAVGHELIPIGQSLLHMMIFAGVWLVIRRDLPPWGIGLVILTGLFVQKQEMIDGLLFRSLLAAGLYPSANPQWIKLSLIMITALILAIMVGIRRLRSLDRLFMTIILLMNLALVTLFHLVLVEGALAAATRRSADLMQSVAMAPEPLYSELCSRLDLECYGWLDGQPLPQLAPEEMLALAPLVQQLSWQKEASHHWLYSRNFSLTTHVQASYSRSGYQNRLIIDDGPLGRVTHKYQAWFYLLQIIAGYAWFFGGLLLLFLHKRRLGRRRRI